MECAVSVYIKYLFVGIAMIASLHVSVSENGVDGVCYLHKYRQWPDNDCRDIISVSPWGIQGKKLKITHNYFNATIQNNSLATITKVIFSNTCHCTCNCTCEQISESNQSVSEEMTVLPDAGCYQFVYNPGFKKSCCITKTEPEIPEAEVEDNRDNNTSILTLSTTSTPTSSYAIYGFFANYWILLLCLFVSLFAVCALSVLALWFFKWKRVSNQMISVDRNKVELATDPEHQSCTNSISIKKKDIVLMYAKDCDAFQATASLLYHILKSALKCKVYDMHQDEYHGEILEDGFKWLTSKLNECDTVVIISEAALSLECPNLGHIDQDPVTELQKYFFLECLHNVHANSNVLYVRFENFSPAGFFKLLTPSLMYTLPSLLGDLLDALDPDSKSHQDFIVWEEQLRDSIKKLSEYKEENPEYLSNM